MMNDASRVILELVGAAGFTITIDADKVTAVNQETGERFIVRYEPDYFCEATMELAQQVGMQLEDG